MPAGRGVSEDLRESQLAVTERAPLKALPSESLGAPQAEKQNTACYGQEKK